ncbi:neuropeptide Y receptor type 1-like [Mercenaria mercenaria]|uniref:neuropeptide Y receptor type 1-like n=1 Tax=Mercenaria mercenaria TaxID=6596 RepID=UPI00234E4524|nr:neuropeptide Y receptor type 1-like [Mercenaria mercenaria]
MNHTTLTPSSTDSDFIYDYHSGDGYQDEVPSTGNSTHGTNDPYDYYYYYDDYSYGTQSIYYYEGFDFERPVFLYIWVVLIIVTTLANIIVMVVLRRRNMRNATNTILIAVAISDSMTGLVTLPVTIYAYQQYEEGDLALTKQWCEAFMITRYFVNRGFHTMSIWLTVVLGFQRLISVSFPFRAQTIFTIRNTVIIILVVVFLAPFLHIYHAFDKKAIEDEEYGNYCKWKVETPCKESCAYFWLIIVLMHFIPCILLVIFTITMVVMMNDATRKMKDSQMIANKANLHRRHMESKRISCIVIAVVIVFLIPEIPYGVFLLVQVCLKHSKKNLLKVKTSRAIICAYEILLVLSFHANFWIYLIMNRKFRRGLHRTFEPIESIIYAILSKFGIQRQRPRRFSDTTTSLGRSPSDAQSMPTQTVHSRISHSNSINSNALEMRTYHFNTDKNGNGVQF